MMIENIKNIFKKVIGIFTKSDIKNVFGIELAPSLMDEAIIRWKQAYTNKNGLRLPAAIASETARLVTLEMKSEIKGSPRGDYLNQSYSNLIDALRNHVEYACAMGGMVFKPYVSGGEIHIDTVKADGFIPVAFDDEGNMTAAVFVDRIRLAKKFYTRLEYHSLKDEIYTVRNRAFVSDDEHNLGKSIPLSLVSAWAELKNEENIAGVDKPLFSYFKMPMANCVDTDSPLGISVFEKAIEGIKDAEKQYKSLLWEFKSGERFVGMAESAIRKDKNGKPAIPEGDKRLIRLFDWDNTSGDDMFKEWSPTMREQNYINGLQTMLRLIEYNSSLAYGTLSNPESVEKTAEEIRASKQRSYSHISDIQKSLQKSLKHLIWILDTYATLYNLAPEGEYEVNFEFDDSIVADRKAQFAEYSELVSMGIMLPHELRMWYFGESEEEARAKINNVDMTEE